MKGLRIKKEQGSDVLVKKSGGIGKRWAEKQALQCK